MITLPWWGWIPLSIILVASVWIWVRPAQSHSLDAEDDVHTALDELVWIADEALANGLRVLGGSGAGKTILAAHLVFWLFIHHHRASYVFDPTGSFLSTFATYLQGYCESQGLSEAEAATLWDRVMVCELSGQSGYVVPVPQCTPFPGESLMSVVNRVLTWALAANPESQGAAIMGKSAFEKVLTPAILVLAANGLQLSELPDLLNHPKAERWQDRYQYALEHYPQETAEAVTFWREEFARWDKATKKQHLTIVDSFLRPYRYDNVWRTTLSGGISGLDDQEIIDSGKVVFIVADGVEGDTKQQLLDWHLRRLVSFLERRGSGRGPDKPPFGLFIDEIATLYTPSDKGMEIFAQLLGQIVHRLRRQYGIHPLCILHQSEAQLHEQIASHLAALGQVIGRPADYDSGLQLAAQVFDQQPLVKYWNPVLMQLPDQGIVEVDRRPVEFTRDEKLHQQAEILMGLDTFKFLCRLSPYREGGRRAELAQLDFAPYVGRFPDQDWVRNKRQELVAASGMAVDDVLAEIAGRNQPTTSDETEATLGSANSTEDTNHQNDQELDELPPGVEVVEGGYQPGQGNG
ncbi:hypothetical protein KFU94_43425 [Chloroflexi bacterium TSY]|nr:hypothetical protein [Chloroflexi bacterium TSY]